MESKEQFPEHEPRVGLYFYDEENAMLMVFDKDLNPNEVAEVYADSPCGFIMAEALNRRPDDAGKALREALGKASLLAQEAVVFPAEPLKDYLWAFRSQARAVINAIAALSSPQENPEIQTVDFWRKRAAKFEIAVLESLAFSGMTTEETNRYLSQSDWLDSFPELIRSKKNANNHLSSPQEQPCHFCQEGGSKFCQCAPAKVESCLIVGGGHSGGKDCPKCAKDEPARPCGGCAGLGSYLLRGQWTKCQLCSAGDVARFDNQPCPPSPSVAGEPCDLCGGSGFYNVGVLETEKPCRKGCAPAPKPADQEN